MVISWELSLGVISLLPALMQNRGELIFKDDGDGQRVASRRRITQATN